MKLPNNDIRIPTSIQRALYGVISPHLRGVTCDWNNSQITIMSYFDGIINEDERELMEIVATEVIADFPDISQIKNDSFQIDYPQNLSNKTLKIWIYYRNEKLDDIFLTTIKKRHESFYANTIIPHPYDIWLSLQRVFLGHYTQNLGNISFEINNSSVNLLCLYAEELSEIDYKSLDRVNYELKKEISKDVLLKYRILNKYLSIRDQALKSMFYLKMDKYY